MGLLAKASVAIDGSKFKAVNSRDNNFTKGKMERRLAQIEESVARYLSQLDTADRQTAAGEAPSEELAARTTRITEKLTKLEEEVKRLKAIEKEMLAAPDQQISFTDPDSRSMATSGRGSGMVGYNVQAAGDTTNHLIVEVAAREHGQSSEGGIGGKKPRSFRRSRLLQRRGDPRMRRRRHHGHAAKTSESVRRLHAGLQSFLSMRRIEARRKNASAFRLRFSQSYASLRQRLSQAMERSTIQRLGKTTNPLTRSERLTISMSRCGSTFAIAFANCG